MDKQVFIQLYFKARHHLYMSYMPDVQTFGLFVPTSRDLEIGQNIHVLLKILDEPERSFISARVIDKREAGNKAEKPKGLFLQFDDENSLELKNKIDELLSDFTPNTEQKYW